MLENLKKGLCTIFNIKTAEQRKIEKARKGVEKNLNNLLFWLDETLPKIEEYLSQQYPDRMTYSIGMDTSDMTKEDLQLVGEKILKVHDICIKYNTRLVVAGFDRLPRDGTQTFPNTWGSGTDVEIALDTHMTYDWCSHPNYGAMLKEKGPFFHEFSKPKDRPAPSCSLQSS